MYHQSRFKKLVLGVLSLWLFMVHHGAFAATMPVDIPAYINYEGRLTKSSDGIPVSERLNMTFSIYDTKEPTEDNCLYKQTESVALENGLFSVVLGEIPVEVFTEHNQLYIGVKINDNPEMRPLQRITSAAYAYRAEVAKTAENVMGQVNVDSSTGNVGIGTTSPNQALHVAGNARIQSGDLYLGSGLSGSATDMRINYSSNDALGFVVGAGGERMRISNEGNIGIGTTSPSEKLSVNGNIELSGSSTSIINKGNAYLDIAATASGGAIRLKSNSYTSFETNGSERMRIVNNGNVGIGTTEPGARFHVYDEQSSISVNNEVAIFSNAGSDAGYSYVVGPVLVATTDGNGTIGGAYTNNALVKFGIGGGKTGSVTTEYFRINGNGNVGIGTTEPGANLDVGETSGNKFIRVGTTSVNGGLAGVEFGSQVVGSPFTAIVAKGQNYWGRADLHFVLRNVSDTNKYDISTDTKMIIKNNGYVGIGTTSPAWALDVGGQARLIADKPRLRLTNSTNGGNQWQIVSGLPNAEADFSIFDTNAEQYRLYINSSGNVGIGTTAPGYKLDVNGAIHASRGGLLLGSGANDLFGFGVGNNAWDSRGSDVYPYMINYHTGLTFSAHSAYGGIRFYNQSYPDITQSTIAMAINNGNVGIGTTSPNAKLHVRESGLFTNSGTDAGYSYVPKTPILTVTTDGNGIASPSYATNAVFKVGIGGGDAGTVTTEHLRVNLNGNVGIGTTNPLQRLHVAGGGIQVEQLETNSRFGVVFRNPDGYATICSGGRHFNGLGFYTGTDETEKMTILSNGNVGIGTTNPSEKLHVNGNVKVDGTLEATSFKGILSGSVSWSNLTGIPDGFKDNVDNVNDDVSNPSGTYSNMTVGKATSATSATSAGNADTVDNKHASDFAASTHTHNNLQNCSWVNGPYVCSGSGSLQVLCPSGKVVSGVRYYPGDGSCGRLGNHLDVYCCDIY